jgi:hypothetical protein
MTKKEAASERGEGIAAEATWQTGPYDILLSASLKTGSEIVSLTEPDFIRASLKEASS